MDKMIPFFSIKNQYLNNKKNFLDKILQVLDQQSFVGGKFVANFENNFKNYVNSNFAISCNSGTDALWLALKALDIQRNSIVLTTPFSFIASSSEIVAHGAHPVFIDIDKDTYNIDPKKIEEWIENECKQTENTLIHKATGYLVAGILSVDIFGQCANYNQIKKIAQKYNLWIIEDACQAVGAQTKENQTAGTLGDISCFSFYPTKNLGAFGDGGMCTTNNEYLAKKLMRLRNHGRHTHYNYTELGINSRLDGIQAAILDEKLKLLDSFNDKRNKIAKIYNEQLKNIKWLQLPDNQTGKHVYHQYCVKINSEHVNRENLMAILKEIGIGTNIYYPKSLDQIEFLNTDKKLKNDCPISTDLTKTILALPIWPELNLEDVQYICDKLNEIDAKAKNVASGAEGARSIARTHYAKL